MNNKEMCKSLDKVVEGITAALDKIQNGEGLTAGVQLGMMITFVQGLKQGLEAGSTEERET